METIDILLSKKQQNRASNFQSCHERHQQGIKNEMLKVGQLIETLAVESIHCSIEAWPITYPVLHTI